MGAKITAVRSVVDPRLRDIDSAVVVGRIRRAELALHAETGKVLESFQECLRSDIFGIMGIT